MYLLLDYGRGRKLERFGQYVLDRPAPAVEDCRPQRPELWSQAHTQFLRKENLRGVWQDKRAIPESWTIQINGISFCLKRTPVGHLGIFPEQSQNWRWIQDVTRPGMKVLNLFAYTGGSSIAAALRDPSVVVAHVDSARNTVQWAKTNAQLTEREEGKNLSIRWIPEDAGKFVGRELKRGNRYDALILDPPSYGHGNKGETWQIGTDLPLLMDNCLQLTNYQPSYVLLTAHSPDFTQSQMIHLISEKIQGDYQVESGAMRLASTEVHPFDCGDYVRFVRKDLLDEV